MYSTGPWLSHSAHWGSGCSTDNNRKWQSNPSSAHTGARQVGFLSVWRRLGYDLFSVIAHSAPLRLSDKAQSYTHRGANVYIAGKEEGKNRFRNLDNVFKMHIYDSIYTRGRESNGKEEIKDRSNDDTYILPEIAPKVGYDVAMFTFFNHKYFLLNQRKIIT